MKFITALILSLTILTAESGLVSTSNGFMFPSKPVGTYYANRILWGEHYTDHNASTPVVGIAVVVWSNTDNWKYITTTNEKGEFKIEVKPNSAFRIKASDGDTWHEYAKILPAIPVGTTGTDKE